MSSEYSAKKFHPIDINILDANADLVFNVFCKVQDTSEDRFVLYASKKPRYRDKVRELLQSPEFLEELYIHEDDLTLYFEHATNSLRDYVLNSDAPLKKRWQRFMTFPGMSPGSFSMPTPPPKFSVVPTRLWT